MSSKKRTEIAELGKFGLIRELTRKFRTMNESTVASVMGRPDAQALFPDGERAGGTESTTTDEQLPEHDLRDRGDDAAVLLPYRKSSDYMLLATDLMLEGIHFDLTYFPLRHLGYKAVVTGCNDIYAMNGSPQQMTLSIGVSAKLAVEDLQELYEGIRTACEEHGVDLVGGDTSASVTGLVISISTVGKVGKDKISYRSGAQQNDLICITGDVGSAYMGLRLLERERRVLQGVDNPKPQFKGYEYLLRRQLMPAARRDIIEALRGAEIVPNAMIDLSDGLASDLMHICRQSRCGARIYLDRLPIARETHTLAEEMHFDPVVAALNGGGDHELLFTVPLSLQERVARLGGIEIIGHITPEDTGIALTTPDGSDVALQAQGWK